MGNGFIIFFFGHVFASEDACRDLCEYDGPYSCTEGSWSHNGVCFGYFLSDNGYVYSTGANQSIRSSSGTPVKASDAAKILELKRSDVSGDDPDTSRGRCLMIINRIGDMISRLPWDPKARRHLLGLVVRLVTVPENPLEPLEIWERIKGQLFLQQIAMLSPESAAYGLHVKTAILLATHMPNVVVGSEYLFAIQTGLSKFCSLHGIFIRRLLTEFHEGQWKERPLFGHIETYIKYVWAENISLFCPKVMFSTEVRHLAFLERIFSHNKSVDGNLLALFLAGIRPSFAFNDSFEELIKQPVRALVGCSPLVFFHGERESGYGKWFKHVAEGVFSQRGGYFVRNADTGSMHISPFGVNIERFELRYRAIGRFMAMSVIHQVPIGKADLPPWFFSLLLDEKITAADIEYDEQILFNSFRDSSEVSEVDLVNDEERKQFDSLKAGFKDLIPTHVSDKRITGCDLYSIITGGPISVDVEDMIKNIIFQSPFGNETQIDWMKNMIRMMNQDTLRRFIKFVTGKWQIPRAGFEKHKITIKIYGKESMIAILDSRTLSLPLESSESALREMILSALPRGSC
jgi:hypothetical protein